MIISVASAGLVANFTFTANPDINPATASRASRRDSTRANRGRDPRHQPIELRLPTTRVYALARGHREISLSPHNPRSSSGGRLASETATPPDHELRLPY